MQCYNNRNGKDRCPENKGNDRDLNRLTAPADDSYDQITQEVDRTPEGFLETREDL